VMSERSSGGDNVPDGCAGVKQLIAQAVAGAPVRLCRIGLDVSADATDAEMVLVCRSLFALNASVNIFVYYSLGDVFAHTPPYSKRRRDFEALVERELGKAAAVRLVEFGKIARRWPKDRRSEKYPWSYYRTHKPGKPGQPDVKTEPRDLPLTDRSVTIEDGVEVVRYKGPTGRVFVYRGEVKP